MGIEFCKHVCIFSFHLTRQPSIQKLLYTSQVISQPQKRGKRPDLLRSLSSNTETSSAAQSRLSECFTCGGKNNCWQTRLCPPTYRPGWWAVWSTGTCYHARARMSSASCGRGWEPQCPYGILKGILWTQLSSLIQTINTEGAPAQPTWYVRMNSTATA